MIELVVFDMDGVLARLDRTHRLTLLSEMTGKPPAFLQAAIWDSDFEPGAETGAYATGAEYLEEWNRRTGCRLTRAQWVRARRDSMTTEHDVLRLAAALLDQTGIAMLTNNGALLYEALPEVFPEMFRIFGGRAHASFQFKARKPEPQVFERLAARYGVPPARAVVVDDDEEYVDGARQAGLRGILFSGGVELRRRLLGYGFRV